MESNDVNGNNYTKTLENIPIVVYSLPFSIAYIVVSVFIFFDNLLSLIVIWQNPILHTTTYVFVTSLAVTDVGTGLAYTIANSFILLDILQTFPGVDFCSQYLAVMGVCYAMILISVVHMPIIAVERYIYIAYPFVYRRHFTSRRIVLSLCACWVICLLLVIVPATLGEYIGLEKDDQGTILFYDVTVIYPASAVITGFCYGKIVQLARARHQRPKTTSKRNNVSQKEESWRYTMKSIKFFVVTYVAFVLFTLPLACVVVTQHFNTQVPNTVYKTTVLLSVFVSTTNVVALAVLNTEFRSSMIRTCTCTCCRS